MKSKDKWDEGVNLVTKPWIETLAASFFEVFWKVGFDCFTKAPWNTHHQQQLILNEKPWMKFNLLVSMCFGRFWSKFGNFRASWLYASRPTNEMHPCKNELSVEAQCTTLTVCAAPPAQCAVPIILQWFSPNFSFADQIFSILLLFCKWAYQMKE